MNSVFTFVAIALGALGFALHGTAAVLLLVSAIVVASVPVVVYLVQLNPPDSWHALRRAEQRRDARRLRVERSTTR